MIQDFTGKFFYFSREYLSLIKIDYLFRFLSFAVLPVIISLTFELKQISLNQNASFAVPIVKAINWSHKLWYTIGQNCCFYVVSH